MSRAASLALVVAAPAAPAGASAAAAPSDITAIGLVADTNADRLVEFGATEAVLQTFGSTGGGHGLIRRPHPP